MSRIPLRRERERTIFDHWKVSGIMTYGSGRQVSATVLCYQDGNLSNDRLPGYGRNAFTGPDYASLDLKLGRLRNLGERVHLELSGDSFNFFNRNNERLVITDNEFLPHCGTVH